jgi:hypothetical protein
LKKEIFQISKCLPAPTRKHFPATGKTQSDWWIFLAIPNKTNMAAKEEVMHSCQRLAIFEIF